MSNKTREELIVEALDQLGIIVPGQAPSTAIMAKMDGIVDPVIEELAGLDVYYVADAGAEGPTGGEIEPAAFLSLAAYLANAAAAKFNLPNDTKMKALALEAESKLKTLARPASINEILKIDAGIPSGRSGRWRRWDMGTL